MSNSKLDQIVKGAPAPSTIAAAIPSLSSDSKSRLSQSPSFPATVIPLSETPSDLPTSSPSQIYLNLLVLEASLRSQYLTLRDRRRQNTFFIFLLAIWLAGFTYLLFLRPREDGIGIGGSVYWVVETSEKVALLGGIVTAVLIWGTGQWDRGVRWPRRWLTVANRGLRNINAKLIVIKGPWWRELFGHFVFLFPYSALFPPTTPSVVYSSTVSSRGWPEQNQDNASEEDLSPGGDHIKLLLLPKPFSSDFRENWEMYRLEYWEKENERRAKLRQLLQKDGKERAKKEGEWFWWLRGRASQRSINMIDQSRGPKVQHKQPQEKERQRRLSSTRSESYSRNASRSSTPSSFDQEDRSHVSSRTRRGSTTTGTNERRRRPKASTSASFELDPASKLSPISRPA